MVSKKLPFGSWPSSLKPEDVVRSSLRLGQVQSSQTSIYWSETRPEEKGRTALMRAKYKSGLKEPFETSGEVLPSHYSIGSKVHEYGGGAFLVTSDDVVFFINQTDQQIYNYHLEGDVKQITDAVNYRFADMTFDATRQHLYAVAEIHSNNHFPENFLVRIDLRAAPSDEKNIQLITKDSDFYASPRLSPDGTRLCWLSWNLPHMPWESASVHVANLNESGDVTHAHMLTDGQNNAAFQPEWLADDSLVFVWDQDGDNSLYRWSGLSRQYPPEKLTSSTADYGQPQWVFGMRKFAADPELNIFASSMTRGDFALEKISLEKTHQDPITEITNKLECPLVDFEQTSWCQGWVCGLAKSSTRPSHILAFQPKTGHCQTLQNSSATNIAADQLSVAQTLQFATKDGTQIAGLYYPPHNPEFTAPADALPPVILNVHGGPTAACDRGMDLRIQYWTSRGFAWFDIDYSGSTGYGRPFRERLNGYWGQCDVEDMEAAARFLVEAKLGHPDQLIIRGSSAGGYTVLMTLAKSKLFAAGTSWYGIGDLLKLEEATHKFESGYVRTLTGANDSNMEEVYQNRSPLHFANQISSPVLILQGGKDKVVPPEQADMIVAALKANDTPVYRLDFPEEGHGFRQAETIIAALGTEYAFYAKYLNLKVQGELSPLTPC